MGRVRSLIACRNAQRQAVAHIPEAERANPRILLARDRLYKWMADGERESELREYAMGLLAGQME